MPTVHSSPYSHIENPALISLLRHTTNDKRRKSSSSGGILKMFKLIPMLTSGCKMVALLAAGKPRKALLADHASTGTLFGYRKGRVSLAIQENPHSPAMFVIELPMPTSAFHKEMDSDTVRIALECDSKSQKRKLLEEYVWAVYCNGRKIGYSIRRKNMSDDEIHVMQTLRGVSMGAGVLPGMSSSDKENGAAGSGGDGEMTYLRARFERVIGSKNSESFYMINPDGSAGGTTELSIFFLRVR